MKDIFVIFILIIIIPLTLFSQVKDIYFGSGQKDFVTVSASDNHQLYAGTDTAFAINSVNGKGMLADRMEASRFLSQAAFGANMALVDTVVNMGIEAWIDSQFLTTPILFTDSIKGIYEDAKVFWFENGHTDDYVSMPDESHMNYAWWQNVMTTEDVLRQKVAYALSQILVVSAESELRGYGVGLANFYDIFVKNAFGNFYDVLLNVSLHPAMGNYLTHYGNRKSDVPNNSFPDENYAREIMQLFCIGLDSLNLDGTPVLDIDGNRIPTYDNDDVAEFAKIFTGLGAGDVADYVNWTDEPYFDLSFYGAKKDTLMAMYEEHHEPGIKYLLNGYIIPAGQSGMDDIEDAIQHLFDHPNVGPFISYRLIQRLIKSNPTPDYVAHVASVFNDNGTGERGNLMDVVRAILLHPEARACSWINDDDQGKLREPILRKTHFLKSIGLILSPRNNYWNYHEWFKNETGQHPLHSPSVFNFYKPSFTPNGAIEAAGNVAPEFGIYNSRTSIGFSRQVYRWIEEDRALQAAWRDNYEKASIDLVSLNELAKDADALLDHLDVLLTHGELSANTRSIIKETLNEFGTDPDDIDSRVRLATYLVMISPDYNILK